MNRRVHVSLYSHRTLHHWHVWPLPLVGVCVCMLDALSQFSTFRHRRGRPRGGGYTTVGGVVGAKLWHVLEDLSLLMHQPLLVLFDRAGFAWFGGLLAEIAVLVWQGRQAKIGGLGMLDLASPAVSVGYGVGRIGCLVSGDGDYGIPTHLPWGMKFPERAGSHHSEGSPHAHLRTGGRFADRRLFMAEGSKIR